MKVLVYVESPYQLVNALSYLDNNPLSKVKVLIRDNGSKLQRKQFEKIVNMTGGLSFEFVYLPNNILKKSTLLPLIIGRMIKYIFFCKTVILGDARSIVAKLILPICSLMRKQIVLVDDGLYLLSFVNKIISKNYVLFSCLPLLKFIDNKSPIQLTFIEDKVVKAPVHNGNNLCFIGMKLPEIGFMDIDVYMGVLKTLARGNKDKSLIYYAHRAEDINKLKDIQKLGFDVIQGDMPLEQLFIKQGAPQGEFYTFYSTAIYNISRMLDSCQFFAIEPDLTLWPVSARDNIGMCYELFKHSNIKLKSIKEV